MRRLLKKLITPGLLILLIALTVRMFFLIYQVKVGDIWSGRPYIPTADRRNYDSIATSFLKGYGLNWYNIQQAHYPPAYSIFLAFIYSFSGHTYYSYLAVFLIQAFLSSLEAVFVYWIGKRIFNPLTGFMAGLAISFYFPFINVIQDLELENLIIFMPLLFIVSLLKVEDSNSLKNKIVAGLIMGLTILTKGIFLIVLPLLVFLWILTRKLKNNWKTILIIYLSAGVILSIWVGRNFLLYNKFLFSSQSGSSLWIATNPDYGTYSREEAKVFFEEQQQLNEAERNSYYSQIAVENLKKYPALYLKRVGQNWQHLFYQKSPEDLSIWLAGLGAIGLILAGIKKNRLALLLSIFFLLLCSQYSLLFTYTRFRMPLDWILILLAAYVLALPIKQVISPRLLKYLMATDQKILHGVKQLGLIIVAILLILFLTKIGLVYLFPKKTMILPNQSGITYLEIHDYQKENQGSLEPFLNQEIIWTGEVNYLNHNALYPLGSAKHSEDNLNPEYAGFYDIYFLPSTAYSTFDLIINRGKYPGYYGDGVVMINYKGSLINRIKNDEMVTISGKIIGQNFFGQIYIEGYEISK